MGKFAVQSELKPDPAESKLYFVFVANPIIGVALNGVLPYLVPVDARKQVRVVDEDNARVIPAVRV